MSEDFGTLSALAREAKRAGRLDEALGWNRRAVAAAPRSGVAEHNLAATLGDLSRFAEAEAATARAFAKGVNAPETWLVRGRALQGLGRLAEAEAAFAAAIAQRPLYEDAQRDLAQLIWMREGDLTRTLSLLDATLAVAPGAIALLLLRARLLATAGATGDAADALDRAIALAPAEHDLHLARARIAAELHDPARHLHHAAAALRVRPPSRSAAKAVVEALLHAGHVEEAERRVGQLLAGAPDDQGLLALLSLCWRLRGDPRHVPLCEDPALIAQIPIELPDGWADLASFLADLRAVLDRLHGWRAHPLDQSLRGGSQTQADLSRSGEPVVRALFAAFDAPIRRYIAGLGGGGDPLRRRIAKGGYRYKGAWSVLLQPSGHHLDHVHPEGWISSAFHVSVPGTVAAERQGWLAFGRPGTPTTPQISPFRHLRPVAGQLVLFPSYLWHGTERFVGPEPRLTVAFDLIPDA